ncbi:MAG TPA: hypothetical protein VEY09_06825 [Pyrinomonadaceae bacterium]|nr:hypothetical protein [Pyrinomonadaceae bacterium]
MTSEERDRMMNFILEQQAQITVNHQLAQEREAEFRARYEADQELVRERVSRLEESMAEMAQAQTEMQQAQTGMQQAQKEVKRTQAHLNEVVAVMVETHRHTEERLDAFIGVLERYISEDRNGKHGGE